MDWFLFDSLRRNIFWSITNIFILSTAIMNTSILGAAHLGEMIFIPCSYGIFYLTSIKKFVKSLEKDCFDT